MRQTDLPVERLIEMCKAQLLETDECDPHGRAMPAGFLINEIGWAALSEKDLTAQKYLLGLLDHSKTEWRLLAFCYLLQIPKSDLEAGDAAVLEACKKKPENFVLVREALDKLHWLN